MKKIRIAIDGPEGAGKSTISKYLAGNLGILYLDTGAMYRAAAYKAVSMGLDVRSEDEMSGFVKDIILDIKYVDGVMRVYVDNADVTGMIRSKEVTRAASDIAVHQCVRTKMVELQRRIASRRSVVMDGRDIGTYVLKNADIKIFLTASADDRAARRHLELIANGEEPDIEDIRKDIVYRDKNDSTRAFAPLTKAQDAIVFDTTGNTLNETKALLLEYVKEEIEIKKYRLKRTIIENTVRIILKLFYRISVKGIENVPSVGSLIVCANHTSTIDVPMLECYINRLITFVAKKELYKVPFVSFLVRAFDSIPVDRDIKDISAAKESYKRLRRGRCLGIFPEGSRTIHVIKGRKKYRIRTGAVKLAYETSSRLLPVGIKSTFRLFSKIEMVIGKPYFIEYKGDGSKTGVFFKQESVRLMQEIYALTGRENVYIDR